MARFGSFEVDSLRRQLQRGDAVIHLTPKAFDLLTLLIEASPRVVAKAELHARLWPKTFVSDATLIGLVKELRRALDDHDRSAPVIRTVHRVGYAFSAPLESVTPSGPDVGWLVSVERRILLAAGASIVGRDPSCEIWLDHATVSRRHARIVASRGRVELEDLGSKNGTQIGGAPLTGTTALRDGDELRFGQLLLTYRASTAVMQTASQVVVTQAPHPERGA
jgi:DNA-binding winged helix-turn-helix (wHTH) protein